MRLGTNTAGDVVATRAWDAYGNATTTTGTVTPVLGHAGQQTDPETGYQYLRARYYDPTTTQFLTLDPLVATTGEPYAYTGTNPINRTDPTGLYWGEGAVNAVTGGLDDAWDATGGKAATWMYEYSGEISTALNWMSTGAYILRGECRRRLWRVNLVRDLHRSAEDGLRCRNESRVLRPWPGGHRGHVMLKTQGRASSSGHGVDC